MTQPKQPSKKKASAPSNKLPAGKAEPAKSEAVAKLRIANALARAMAATEPKAAKDRD